MFSNILDYLILLVDSFSYDFRETFPGKYVARNAPSHPCWQKHLLLS